MARRNDKNSSQRRATNRTSNTNRANKRISKSVKNIKNNTNRAEAYNGRIQKKVKKNDFFEEDLKRRKPVKRNSGKIARFIISVMFLIIIIYLTIYIFKVFNKSPVDFETISYGTIDNPKTITGVIIRDEEVYTTNKAGIITFNKSNYSKVRSKDKIATVGNAEIVKVIKEDLSKINSQILNIQELRDDIFMFSEDIKRVNNQIFSIINKEMFDFRTDEGMSSIYELKSLVQSKIEVRNQIILSENSGSLAELSNRKTSQEKAYAKNTDVIYSKNSGILSYYLDGLEDKYTLKDLETLTKEDTSKIYGSESLEIKASVDKGDAIFKIINNNKWYIASYIQNNYIEEWEEGRNVNIYLKNKDITQKSEFFVEKIDKRAKESYVILSSTKNMIDYIDERSLTFEVGKVKEGFKVKNSSIVEENLLKIPSEYIVDGTITKKVDTGTHTMSINESGNDPDGNFTYIPIEFGIINIGDILVNPNNQLQTYTISEIQTTKGVYVINSGIANFKKINLENAIENNVYTILDTNNNTNIKLYDRVIVDAKNIFREDQVFN